MIAYEVDVITPAGQTLYCGRLALSEPDSQGRYRSEFAYDRRYIEQPHHFALDPISLPLGLAHVQAQQLYPPLAIFDDALPDRWGRRLMDQLHHLPFKQRREPIYLGLLGDAGLGALRFRGLENAPEPLKPDTSAARATLDELLDAAAAFERHEFTPSRALDQLLRAGRTPGGARPKAILHIGASQWLAKFPSTVLDEGLDIVGLEAATLTIAQRAGLEVPEHRVQTLGTGPNPRRVLLVRRFDVTGENGQGRAHMASLRTLCRERPGADVLSYAELAATVQKVSAAPAQDVAALYRHMVLNAAVGNTDDHLKNFWMLHTESGWRLAPAIDLLPDVGQRREHALTFDWVAPSPSRTALLNAARQWGVNAPNAIIDQVCDAVLHWSDVAASLAVQPHSIDVCGRDIARRLALLMPG